MIEKSEDQKFYKSGQVHQGFLKAYNTIAQEISNTLRGDNIARFVNKDVKGSMDIITDIPLGSILKTQFCHVGDECVLTPQGSEIYEGFPKLKLLRTPHRIEGYKAVYTVQRQCNPQQKNSEKKSGLLNKMTSRLENLNK